jgi:hypothetical protein
LFWSDRLLLVSLMRTKWRCQLLSLVLHVRWKRQAMPRHCSEGTQWRQNSWRLGPVWQVATTWHQHFGLYWTTWSNRLRAMSATKWTPANLRTQAQSPKTWRTFRTHVNSSSLVFSTLFRNAHCHSEVWLTICATKSSLVSLRCVVPLSLSRLLRWNSHTLHYLN